jgi:hypothetical protein
MLARTPILFLLPILAADGDASAAQGPTSGATESSVAVRFRGGAIRMDEFESYLAFRYMREAIAKEAVDYLVRDAVVTAEVERRGIVVTPEDVQKSIASMEVQLRQATGHALDQELAEKGMDRATFEAIYRKQIACERLARADLGIAAGDAVRPEQQELWIQEKVKNAGVVRDGLPRGVFATVGGTRIDARAVGHTIRLKLSKGDTRDALRACAGIRLAEERARAAGIDTTQDDVEAAIQRRRDRFAANPLMQGVTFEQFLDARGMSLDDFREDPALRAESMLWKLALQQFPDEDVDKRYLANRDYYDGIHGEQRRISWILFFAGATKNELVQKTYEEADADLKSMLVRATSADEFARLAAIYSKHEDTRKKNGEIGWVHRRDSRIDPRLLAFAFAPDTPIGKASGPVHTDSGSALVFVHGTKPGPDAATMRRNVRSELMGEMYKKFVEEAKIETYLDPKPASAPVQEK